MTDQLEISRDGRLGCIALNRPAAINALSLEMIEAITVALDAWRDDAGIATVLFTGNGPKGFCSGGDVRAARALVLEGRPDVADAYFAAEYRMNGLIASYAKPLVAIGHGIVMGGGIGIAGHCRFRIAHAGARFAMPEAAIGFFSDVGVNAIMARAPVNRALLFLMSGVSVAAADAVALGLADIVVPAERVGAVRAALVEASAASRPESEIARLMAAEAIEAGPAEFCGLADLLPARTPASPQAFVASVRAEPRLREISTLVATRSPSALAAIFYSHLGARRLMDVGETLAMDLRLARLMARSADFSEGVRAVLIDKDQSPRWSPPELSGVDPANILDAVKVL